MANSEEKENNNGPFVPLFDHVLLQGKCERLEQEREALNTEVLQLREALKQVNAGIHKASDIAEGVIETRDQQIITNLAIDLLKHHPKKLSIRYKAGEWKEVYHE